MVVKPGYKTTELLAVVLLAVGTVAASIQGSLSPRYAAIANAVSVAAYAISRAITKAGVASSPSTIVTTQPLSATTTQARIEV